MKNSFYPQSHETTREVIAEMISDSLSDPIGPYDPRLTDELCQEIVDNWNAGDLWDEEVTNPLWSDPDTLEEEWEDRLTNIFSKQTEL